jgi:hypothetical protein
MGRRSRQRATPQQLAKVRSQPARVRVTDDVWRTFRQACGDRPVSEVLAGHVERDVAAWLARDTSMSDREVVDALGRARELHAAAEALVRRIELRLAYAPPLAVRDER